MGRRRVRIQAMTVLLRSLLRPPSHSIWCRSNHNSHYGCVDVRSSVAFASYATPVRQLFAGEVQSRLERFGASVQFSSLLRHRFLSAARTPRQTHKRAARVDNAKSSHPFMMILQGLQVPALERTQQVKMSVDFPDGSNY